MAIGTNELFGSLFVAGSIRSEVGYPLHCDNCGFAFANHSQTGLFLDTLGESISLSPSHNSIVLPRPLGDELNTHTHTQTHHIFYCAAPELGLFVDGIPSLRLPRPGSSASGVMVLDSLSVEQGLLVGGNVSIRGDDFYLGSSPAGLALAVVERESPSLRVLRLNGHEDFRGGTAIGQDQVVVRRDPLTGNTTVTVGKVTPSGSLRSAGSVRASLGLPFATDPLDAGFAFGDLSSTGLFGDLMENSTTHRLALFVEGQEVASFPAGTSSTPVTVAKSFVSQGRLESVLGQVFLQGKTALQQGLHQLEINPGDEFSEGVLIGSGHMLVRASPSSNATRVRMGLLGSLDEETDVGRTLFVSGGVQAASGLPSATTSLDVGYSLSLASSQPITFQNRSTGLYAARNLTALLGVQSQSVGLSLVVDDQPRLTLPASLSGVPLTLHDATTVLGQLTVASAVQVDSGALTMTPLHAVSMLALNSTLYLNPNNEFGSGIVLGDQQAHIRRMDVDHVQATFGSVPFSGTLRSAGAVRAAKGTPSLSTTPASFDAGFAFDEDSTTGWFASSSAGAGNSSVELHIGGIPRIVVPPNSNGLEDPLRFANSRGVVFEDGPVTIESGVLGMLTSRKAALVADPAMDMLVLNPQGLYAGGVQIGNSTDVRIFASTPSTPTQVAIGSEDPLDGTLRVAGTILAATGFPSLAGSTGSGFSFAHASNTGLFSNGWWIRVSFSSLSGS